MGRWIEAEFPGLCEAKESPWESELVQRRLWQSDGLVESKTNLSGASWAREQTVQILEVVQLCLTSSTANALQLNLDNLSRSGYWNSFASSFGCPAWDALSQSLMVS